MTEVPVSLPPLQLIPSIQAHSQPSQVTKGLTSNLTAANAAVVDQTGISSTNLTACSSPSSSSPDSFPTPWTDHTSSLVSLLQPRERDHEHRSRLGDWTRSKAGSDGDELDDKTARVRNEEIACQSSELGCGGLGGCDVEHCGQGRSRAGSKRELSADRKRCSLEQEQPENVDRSPYSCLRRRRAKSSSSWVVAFSRKQLAPRLHFERKRSSQAGTPD